MSVCETCGSFVVDGQCPNGCAQPIVSEGGDTLDSLVQAASSPSLVFLFRKAKAAGVLGPVTTYGEQGGSA